MTSIPTSLVGSYAQPDWLIDRERLRDRFPPRVRAAELWRVGAEPYLAQAQDDATLLAIRRSAPGWTSSPMVRCARELLQSLCDCAGGLDVDNPALAGPPRPPNRCVRVGRIARRHPVEVRDVEFFRPTRAARSRSRCRARLPCRYRRRTTTTGIRLRSAWVRRRGERRDPGPVRGRRGHRPGRRAVQEGAPDAARAYGLEVSIAPSRPSPAPPRCTLFGYAANTTIEPGYAFLAELRPPKAHGDHRGGAVRPRLGALDALGGKTIVLGALDLGDARVESAADVAARIRAALAYVPGPRS